MIISGTDHHLSRGISLLGAHKPGRSLAAAVQTRQGPIIQARTLIAESLLQNPQTIERFAAIFSTRAPQQFTDIGEQTVIERAAWALINMYFLYSKSGKRKIESLKSAEEWFFGGRRRELPSLAACVHPSVDQCCARSLSVVADDVEFDSLLPYLLEPFDFAHRLNERRNSDFAKRRRLKRTSGTFYTPQDVVEAIVRHGLDLALNGGRVLDPACGSGVFLLTMLRELRASGDRRTPLEICVTSLYGIDVSHLAIESCAFVLAHACLDANLDPWATWQLLRLNLWACDATKVDHIANHSDVTERQRARHLLFAEHGIPDPLSGSPELTPPVADYFRPRVVSEVFPEASAGFEVVVSNPPYVRNATERRNLYIPFVELMLTVAHRDHSFVGAALPLSIAFASDHDTKDLRSRLSRAPGVCRFAFFDREPHGLFGEEVKVRTALLFRTMNQDEHPAHVQTTALMRLTSRSRAALLRDIPSVDLGSMPIRDGVPKLGSPIEVAAYLVLAPSKRHGAFTEKIFSQSFSSCLTDSPDRCIFVGPVAYNFLNIVRRFRPEHRRAGTPTRSSFLRCEFLDPSAADAAFAFFSSRIPYWLWNVEGDGFHVTKRFVESLMTCWSRVSPEARVTLAALGRRLWDAEVDSPIISINSGVWSVAFSPLFHQKIISDIDSIVAAELTLSPEFTATIQRGFVERIVISPEESKRSQLVG